VKPNINSVGVHPQLSNKGHPVDVVLVGAGFTLAHSSNLQRKNIKKKLQE
jgi:hypothetical protein